MTLQKAVMGEDTRHTASFYDYSQEPMKSEINLESSKNNLFLKDFCEKKIGGTSQSRNINSTHGSHQVI